MADETPAPDGIRQTLELLARMLQGERLRVRDGVVDGGPQWPAVQRRLRCLADTLAPVRRASEHPESYEWAWPSSEASTPATVWSLAAARTMLHGFSDSVIGDTLRGLLEDHRARLPPRSDGAIPPDPARMFFANTRLVQPLGLEADVVERVARAMFECRVLHAKYTQFEGASIRLSLEPWSVLFSDSGVYVYGLCVDCEKEHHVQTRRLYNLARMSDIRSGDQRFAYPTREEYDPLTLFEHSFGVFLPANESAAPAKVVLRFAPEWRSYLIRHRLHRAQETPTYLDDGWTLVRMRLHITYDLVRWVRGLGLEVEVLGPKLLKDWVTSGQGGNFYKAQQVAG